jgi:hypothetical protein
MIGTEKTWFTARRGRSETLAPARWNSIESKTMKEPGSAVTGVSSWAATSGEGNASIRCDAGITVVAPVSTRNGSMQKSALTASGRLETKCWYGRSR